MDVLAKRVQGLMLRTASSIDHPNAKQDTHKPMEAFVATIATHDRNAQHPCKGFSLESQRPWDAA